MSSPITEVGFNLSLRRSGTCSEQRCFKKLQSTDNATNDGLKTVDEAVAMDKAEMTTPDALD